MISLICAVLSVLAYRKPFELTTCVIHTDAEGCAGQRQSLSFRAGQTHSSSFSRSCTVHPTAHIPLHTTTQPQYWFTQKDFPFKTSLLTDTAVHPKYRRSSVMKKTDGDVLFQIESFDGCGNTALLALYGWAVATKRNIGWGAGCIRSRWSDAQPL